MDRGLKRRLEFESRDRKSTRFLWIIVIALLITNLVTVYFLRTKIDSDNHKNFSFVNPYFFDSHGYVVSKKGYSELKYNLSEYIEEKKKQGEADIVGVWFRDLEFGPTFGINDRTDFIPASLLKLPLAMTFLSLSEDDPGILDKTITYNGTESPVLDQTFSPRRVINTGQQYTLDELISYSITDSSNVASELLYEYLEKNHPGELSNTYRDLGILDPRHDFNMAGVNTKGYGSIFRMIYNVSFLNLENSEKLLSILSQTYFDRGLRAGVPENIKIAHKFGERYLEDGTKQLHDCGIIYYPDNPYQLCVMTRGNDFNKLSEIIGRVSKMVYEEFDSRKLD